LPELHLRRLPAPPGPVQARARGPPAVVAAGIGVELAAEWIGTRTDERKAHNAHGTRVCPCCRRPRARQLRLFTGGGRSAALTPRRIAA